MAVPGARRGRDGRAEERKCGGTSAGTVRVVLKLVSSKYLGCYSARVFVAVFGDFFGAFVAVTTANFFW